MKHKIKPQLELVDKIIQKLDVKKKRANVEYNGMELVVAILFANSNIINANNLMEKINDEELYSKIKLNTFGELNKYKEDILKKTYMLNNYINHFRETMNCIEFLPENIKTIFISGKKNKHPKIDNLNQSLDKKATKSDIYIELHDDTIFGVSVKQSSNAPLSNYSVQCLLDKETNNLLTEIKKKYLQEHRNSQFLRDEFICM